MGLFTQLSTTIRFPSRLGSDTFFAIGERDALQVCYWSLKICTRYLLNSDCPFYGVAVYDYSISTALSGIFEIVKIDEKSTSLLLFSTANLLLSTISVAYLYVYEIISAIKQKFQKNKFYLNRFKYPGVA